MGYSYTQNGKLCCDVCGGHPSRRYRCPFGYCQAIALCANCKAAHPEYISAKTHREYGCEDAHNQNVARYEKRKELIDSGAFVRSSALGRYIIGGGYVVQVIFQGKIDYQAFWMHKETYDAFPLLDPVTPDDYRKHGILVPAPVDFAEPGGVYAGDVSNPFTEMVGEKLKRNCNVSALVFVVN